jgi:phage gpG-like protein
MALLRFSVGVEGDKNVTRVLGLAAEKVGDLSPAFERMAEVAEAHWNRKFKNRGVDPKAPGDAPWRGYDSEPVYREYKHRRLGGQATTAIGRWNPQAGAPFAPRERLGPSFALTTHSEHVREIRPKGMRVGSNVPYAPAFQSGGPPTPFDGVSQPARPVVTANRKLIDTWTRIIHAHVDEAFATRGPGGRRLTGVRGRRQPIRGIDL